VLFEINVKTENSNRGPDCTARLRRFNKIGLDKKKKNLNIVPPEEIQNYFKTLTRKLNIMFFDRGMCIINQN